MGVNRNFLVLGTRVELDEPLSFRDDILLFVLDHCLLFHPQIERHIIGSTIYLPIALSRLDTSTLQRIWPSGPILPPGKLL